MVSFYRLIGGAIALGLAASGGAFVLVKLIGLITNLALLHRWGWELPPSRSIPAGPALLPVAMAGGLVVSLLARWAPTIRGHGIPEAMEAILTKQSRISPRTAVAKPVSAAVAIGTGGPFGAEGPIIVTGGALGSLLGQVLPCSPAERKVLLCAGAGAGMAATFGAPLAAVVLAVELLLFELSLRALIPLIVATSIAGGMHSWMFEQGPLFAVPAHDFIGLRSMPAFAVLGLACGVLAAVVGKGLFVVEAGFRRLPLDDLWHPVLGAAGFALVGMVVPGALGVGYDEIGDVLGGHLALGTMAALLVAKLLAWWLALGSGTSGGTLAPLLLVGGSFGALFGHAALQVLPGPQPSISAFGMVAMAATFAAATRTPFTSIVFVFELTRDYDAVLPLMGATALAVVVARLLLHESLMTEKLERRGLTVDNTYEADPTRMTPVEAVMSAPVDTIPAGADVEAARRIVAEGAHSGYPVVDDEGRCVGMLTRTDVLAGTAVPAGAPVLDLASTDIVAVAPDAPVRHALGLMVTEEVEHLPVVREGRLVGMCTRTDVLRARAALDAQEQPDPGWVNVGLSLRAAPRGVARSPRSRRSTRARRRGS